MSSYRQNKPEVRRKRVGFAAVLVAVLSTFSPSVALGAPVEEDLDGGRGFFCFLPSEPGFEVIIGVHDGAIEGQTAFIDLIGPGYREEAVGTSTWTDSTFTADIDLVGPEDSVHLEGTYASAGPAEESHGVDRHGNSVLVGWTSNAPIAVEFTEIEVGGIAFDLEAAGGTCEGGYFDLRALHTSPASSVSHQSLLLTGDCLTKDGSFVEVDRERHSSDVQVRGEVLQGFGTLGRDGTMEWFDAMTGEPLGTSAMSAALSPAGPPYVRNESDGPFRVRHQVTPLLFELSTSYPDGRPVTASCEAEEFRSTYFLPPND